MRGEKNSIKAVIFDIGGVLQLGEKTRVSKKDIHISGVHEIIANKLKISIDQYFDSIDTYYAKSIEGTITKSRLLSVLSLNLNYPKNKLEKLYYKTYKKRFKLNKELVQIAKKLKKQGYKVAILSDQWHLSKKAHLDKSFKKLFSPIIISCDVGVRKPNPEIYKLTLKKLKLKAEETIFIDNQIWNLLPTHKFGMNTALYINNKKLKEQLKKFNIKV